jgi:pimeloyl-ACP methyl ester carboxylesterase
MNLHDWRAGGKFFEHRGYPIFYRRSESKNETLLALHGFPTSSHDYHKIWHRLAENFSVTACDMIGYGFSAKPVDFDYTTFAQVDLIEAFVDHLGVEKLHILAHDYGNTITQELLARAEENRLKFEIRSICFLNGALFPETHRPILAQKMLIGRFGFLFARLMTDGLFKKNLASIFGADTQPTDAELDEFLEVFKYNGGRRIAHKLIRYMAERAVYRERWVGALQRMSQPFRFIDGLADKVSGAHLVERFRRLVPHQTDIVELEGVGHFPHFETPDAVTESFFQFQSRV